MSKQYRNTDAPSLPQSVRITFTRCERIEDSPDLSWLEQDYADVADVAEREKYLASDRARLAAYERGDWYMRGLYVEAHIMVPIGQGAFCHYTLESAGLYGVESDCGAEDETEVWDQEEQSLRAAMKQMAVAFAALSSEVQS